MEVRAHIALILVVGWIVAGCGKKQSASAPAAAPVITPPAAVEQNPQTPNPVPPTAVAVDTESNKPPAPVPNPEAAPKEEVLESPEVTPVTETAEDTKKVDPPAVPVEEQSPKPVSPEHAANFVFLGDRAPVFIRLLFHIDGEPLPMARDNWVARLVQQFDKDADKKLSESEFPSILFRQNLIGRDVAFADLDKDEDKLLTEEEIAATVSEGTRVLTLTSGIPLDPRVLDLFRSLDFDYDNALTANEFSNSDENLKKFDLDDDELISIDELGGYQNPMALAVNMRLNETGPFRSLPIASEDKSTRKRLGYYNWSQEYLGLSDEVFKLYDLDGDTVLRGEELERFLAAPAPHLDLGINYSRATKTTEVPSELNTGDIKAVASDEDLGEPAITILSDPALLETVFAKVQQSSDFAILLELDSLQITLRVADTRSIDLQLKQTIHQQFVTFDTDNNGYLEAKELPSTNSPFFGPFADIDTNGDGMVFEEELLPVFQLASHLGGFQSQLGVSMLGRSLFEMLDHNRDRRLSRREILSGAELLPSWDQDGDERLTLAEVPRHYELSLVPQMPPALQFLVPSAGSRQFSRSRQTEPAPAWFGPMDTNGDGDISRREFLGEQEQFDRLDTNKDQILDIKEARQVAPKR